MPGETYAGIRPNVASAREPPQALTWLALTVAVAAAAGAMLGRGEVKLGVLPVAALLVLVFAGVPAAGYVAILWSVGTFVDMLAPRLSRFPRFGRGRRDPALDRPRFACVSTRRRTAPLEGAGQTGKSVVMGVFLAAVVGGVAVGVENGASLHAAAFDMRLMLFYAAFWLALAALTWNRDRVFKLVSAGALVVVILQTLQAIVGQSTRLFVIAPTDLAGTLTDETGFLRVRPPGLTTIYIVAAFALARVLWGPPAQAQRLGDGGGGAHWHRREPQPKHAARARSGALRRGADRSAESPLRGLGGDRRRGGVGVRPTRTELGGRQERGRVALASIPTTRG